MNTIIYIGGGKGGVGKSKLSFAMLDYLLNKKEEKTVLIETDTANPDVYKAHMNEDSIICKQCDLDNADGWIKLVNYCDEFKDNPVVINSAARNQKGVKKYSQTLLSTLNELDRQLITFWIINRQKDSIGLLKNYTESVSNKVYVWRNLYFGEEDKFQLYNTSKIRVEIESKTATLNFPDLADRVADKIYSDRISIKQGLSDFQIGDRAELQRWRNIVFQEMDKIQWT